MVLEVKEGLGLCSTYPLETEAGLMVAATVIACFTLFAGLPLTLAAIGACKRVASVKKGEETPKI